jgi:hypothetical protein
LHVEEAVLAVIGAHGCDVVVEAAREVYALAARATEHTAVAGESCVGAHEAVEVNVSFGEIIARVAVRTYCQEFCIKAFFVKKYVQEQLNTQQSACATQPEYLQLHVDMNSINLHVVLHCNYLILQSTLYS